MATRNFRKWPFDSHEPKEVGAILDEMLRSDSRFAAAFRRYKDAVDNEAKVETGQLFKDLFPDTHLCVDLKLITHQQGRMPVGGSISCMLSRDGDYHYTAVENAIEKKVKTVQRNPVIFAGGCVNVHLLADGSKRLDFNHPRFCTDFSFRDFCVAAAQELLTIASLLGEEDSKE